MRRGEAGVDRDCTIETCQRFVKAVTFRPTSLMLRRFGIPGEMEMVLSI
jgi:hypothetical protein